METKAFCKWQNAFLHCRASGGIAGAGARARGQGGMIMYDLDLLEHTDTVNELLARYGVKFGIYKNNTFKE